MFLTIVRIGVMIVLSALTYHMFHSHKSYLTFVESSVLTIQVLYVTFFILMLVMIRGAKNEIARKERESEEKRARGAKQK